MFCLLCLLASAAASPEKPLGKGVGAASATVRSPAQELCGGGEIRGQSQLERRRVVQAQVRTAAIRRSASCAAHRDGCMIGYLAGWLWPRRWPIEESHPMTVHGRSGPDRRLSCSWDIQGAGPARDSGRDVSIRHFYAYSGRSRETVNTNSPRSSQRAGQGRCERTLRGLFARGHGRIVHHHPRAGR